MNKLAICVILVISLFLASVSCTTQPRSQEESSSLLTAIAEETTGPATEEEPTVTDDLTPTKDETTAPPPIGEDMGEEEIITTEDIPIIIFSASPIDVENIVSIVVLGNLNPPGHVFPTDHIYFYISRQEKINLTKEIVLYSPGTLNVTKVNAIEHLQAGITDYSIELQKGESLHIRLGHVSSLAEDVFGDTTSFQTWEMTNEYSTGDETYRWWSKEHNITLEAGQVIGKVGGNPNQWALDLFLYDLEKTQQNIANPERWTKSWYLHGVDPLSYYEDNPVFEQLLELVDREMSVGERPPYGSVLQDIPGTAQGCWFLEGVNETYPEDPHFALVHDNIRPKFAIISVGNSIRNLQAETYNFIPQESGLLNRDFRDITADKATYGFDVERFDGIIIVHMPDSETLWIEALSGVGIDPSQWVFSIDKTTFKR
ncbi:hypothetical protein ACFLUJ_00910 [Chloroflexota bacterium]